MPPLIIAQLLVQYGLPLTQSLVAMHNSGKTVVTQEDWNNLVKLSNYSSAASLAAAGLQIVGDKVVPLTP